MSDNEISELKPQTADEALDALKNIIRKDDKFILLAYSSCNEKYFSSKDPNDLSFAWTGNGQWSSDELAKIIVDFIGDLKWQEKYEGGTPFFSLALDKEMKEDGR